MSAKKTEPKIIAVLVEGKTEITCLKRVLSSLYERINENYEVVFLLMRQDKGQNGGDITSKNHVYPSQLPGIIIKEYIEPFLKLYGGIEPDYIKEIIHIIDMDGAYIDDSAIWPDAEHEKPFYDAKSILTSNPRNIVDRNKRKRNNIDYLSDELKNITFKKEPKDKASQAIVDYSVYFFSSNLDHVINGNANTPYKDKIRKAEEFARRYKKPEEFIEAIKFLPGTLKDKTYEESWRFIRERGNNSLEPHTNINILLDRIMNSQ